MDESVLIERARRGDRAAANALCELHWRAIYRLLFARLGNRSEAEDLTQEAFARAWKALRTFQGQTYGPYLRTIALNLARNRLRDTARHPTTTFDERLAPGEVESPEDALVDRERAQALEQAMAELAPDQRQVLTLRLFQGHSVHEAATILGRSDEALRALQYRALSRLREIVKKTGDQSLRGGAGR